MFDLKNTPSSRHSPAKHAVRLHRRPLARLTILLAVLSLLLSSLACEMSDTLTWSRTMIAPTETPAITPTIDPEDRGKVDILVDKKLIRVNLDPLGERVMDGVIVQVYELGSSYLVQTFDPAGHYLPSAVVIAKDREPQQEVAAIQVNRTWQWGFSRGEDLDIAPLILEDLGQIPLGSLHQAEALQWGMNGINLILPLPETVDETTVMQVYRTPADHTVLLVPQEAAGAIRVGRGLAAAAPHPGPVDNLLTFFDEYIVLSFFSMPGEPISAYLRAAQAMPVSDYFGLDQDDLDWAVLKAKEDRGGLPLDYVPPRGIDEQTIHWLNYDSSFISSLYFIPFIQEGVPCTDKDQLETVIGQSHPAGSIVNALNQPVILQICDEVLSQSKYQTLTFKTDTPTITSTPRDTSTPAPTRTITQTITLEPSSTGKPTSTAKPSATGAPTRTVTNTTIAPAPSVTTIAPSATIAHTPTESPAIYDDFSTSPTGYDDAYWTTIYTIGGTQEWRGAEKTFVQSVSGTGFPNLYTDKICLLGEAQFRIKTSESSTGSFLIGWVDDPVYGNIANGLFLQSLNTTQIAINSMRDGAVITTPLNVAARNTTWHTYLINWSQDPDDLSLTAEVSVDGGTAVLITSAVPDIRLHFIMGALGFAPGDTASIEIDYIKIFSDSCQ